MALELKIKETEVANNSTTIENDTGVYNVDTNPTGLGTPNPERTDLKLYLRTNHVDKESVEVAVNPAAYDSNTVEIWTESGILDGWKKHYIIGIDKSVNNPSDVDVHAFLDASDLDALTNESTVDIAGTDYTLYITNTDTFPIPQGRMDLIEANEIKEIYRAQFPDDPNLLQEKQVQYDEIRGLLEGATSSWGLEHFSRAQTIIEKANELGEKLYEES